MSFIIELRESVIDDVIEIRTWYENQRVGLGDDFLAAFYATLPTVQRNPAVFASLYRGFRHILIRHFPYGIYFRIEGEKAAVYRVNHTARSVARLRKSLRDFLP